MPKIDDPARRLTYAIRATRQICERLGSCYMLPTSWLDDLAEPYRIGVPPELAAEVLAVKYRDRDRFSAICN
jgi:hypothetical protein